MISSDDHLAMTDAILRFLEGLDGNDPDLTASAFTPDADADLSGLNSRTGVVRGRDTIVTRVVGHVGPMDSMRQITNVRTLVDGDTGTLTCYALAPHFRPGEGHDPGRGGLLMGSRYRATLVRTEPGWRIRHIAIVGIWVDGNQAVIAR